MTRDQETGLRSLMLQPDRIIQIFPSILSKLHGRFQKRVVALLAHGVIVHSMS